MPHWENVISALDEKGVRTATFTEPNIPNDYLEEKISGFPTIAWIDNSAFDELFTIVDKKTREAGVIGKAGKMIPASKMVEYEGPREPDPIVKFALSPYRKMEAESDNKAGGHFDENFAEIFAARNQGRKLKLPHRIRE